jgi:signal transduction histidine kinase
VLATVLSYFAADWFFIIPRFEINLPHEDLDEFLSLMAFVFSCFAIAITSSIMRRALARARQKQRQLENEIRERQRAEEALQQAQAQLREYAGVLEHRVQERTAHLHETIRSLEGVCYHLAHDLRAPLRAMEGFTSILLKEHLERLDPAGMAYLQNISKASQRMDILIQGLMEYGRMGHGSFPLREVNVQPVLRKVLTPLADEISSKGARIELGNEWPEVIANEDLLEVVLSNLVQNSLKFTASPLVPHIRIWAEPSIDHHWRAGGILKSSDRKYIRFIVQDNGIGMPTEHISRAFWIFERLHPRENYAGTGIGLAIVSKAIERMDGRVGAISAVNEGSKFWFELESAVREVNGYSLEDRNVSDTVRFADEMNRRI